MLFFHKNINRSCYIDNIGARLCLSKWTANSGNDHCFYYCHLDYIDNVLFESCIDQQHIDYLRNNKHAKVFYDFCGEPMFAKHVILEIINVVENWQLNTHQVVIVALDRFQEEFLKEILKKSQKKSIIKVVAYNLYLDMLNPKRINSINVAQNKKFSMLCRRHRPWRTYLYSELFDNHLLGHFHFSYHGVDNFKELSTGSIARDISKFCGKRIGKNFKNFLNRRPHTMDNTDFYYSCAETYIDNADIHLAIEHAEFDEKNLKTVCKKQRYFASVDPITGAVCSVGPEGAFDKNNQHLVKIPYDLVENVYAGKTSLNQCNDYIDYNDFDLIDTQQEYFISEKVYKPIVLGKPFIVFSDQGYLAALKTLGFATFAPFIDESYDHELDPAHRIESIVNEIKRINELAPDQYQTLITECNKIAVHNQLVFEKLKKQNRLEL